jgi:hypothetical protein
VNILLVKPEMRKRKRASDGSEADKGNGKTG